MLFENYTQHISSINLTDHQKMILAKAVEAGGIDQPTRVSLGDDKLIAARDLLDDLGIIDYSHEHDLIQITQAGVELMKQDNIIDDTNELTDVGKILIGDKQPGEEVAEQLTFKGFLNTL